MSIESIDELRRLHEAATPGRPWNPAEWCGDEGGYAAIGPHHDDHETAEPGNADHMKAQADAKLIVALRNNAPAIIAALEGAKRLERIEAAAKEVVAMPFNIDPELAALRVSALRDAISGKKTPDPPPHAAALLLRQRASSAGANQCP